MGWKKPEKREREKRTGLGSQSVGGRTLFLTPFSIDREDGRVGAKRESSTHGLALPCRPFFSPFPFPMLLLPRKRHQPRVERDGQQDVTDDETRVGHDGLELDDVVGVGDEAGLGHDDEAGHGDDGKGHAEPELLEHLGHLDEEVGELELLGRRAPRHVDLEHVREDGLGDVDRDAAEEDEEHEEPLEVLGERRQEVALARPVAERCERDVAERIEDDHHRDPDIPAVDVVFVDVCRVKVSCALPRGNRGMAGLGVVGGWEGGGTYSLYTNQ